MVVASALTWVIRSTAVAAAPVRVHRYTMNKQSERRTPRVCRGTPVHYEHTVRKGRMPRVCRGTPVHYEQTVRKEDAASVYGYTGTLGANSQGGECVRMPQRRRRRRRTVQSAPISPRSLLSFASTTRTEMEGRGKHPFGAPNPVVHPRQSYLVRLPCRRHQVLQHGRYPLTSHTSLAQSPAVSHEKNVLRHAGHRVPTCTKGPPCSRAVMSAHLWKASSSSRRS